MKKKKQKKIKLKNISKKLLNTLLLVGFIGIVLGIIIPKPNFLRQILLFLGFLIILSRAILKYQKKFISYLWLILPIISIYAADYLLVRLLSYPPAIGYTVKYDGNISIHNGIGYRVWKCNTEETIIDYLYQSGFYCDSTPLREVDINYLLTEIEDNYEDFKNEFINVSGKVSTKEGIHSLVMRPYEIISGALNGSVSFETGVSLRCDFKDESLGNYSVYDNAVVTGRVTSLNKNGDELVVKMKDCKMVSSKEYDEYTLDITTKTKCQDKEKFFFATSDEYNFYTLCIDTALVKYSTKDIYELSYVLSENKLRLPDLLKNALETKDFNLGKQYLFKTHSLIVCDENLSNNKDVIIGNTSLNHQDNYCEPKKVENQLE